MALAAGLDTDIRRLCADVMMKAARLPLGTPAAPPIPPKSTATDWRRTAALIVPAVAPFDPADGLPAASVSLREGTQQQQRQWS